MAVTERRHGDWPALPASCCQSLALWQQRLPGSGCRLAQWATGQGPGRGSEWQAHSASDWHWQLEPRRRRGHSDLGPGQGLGLDRSGPPVPPRRPGPEPILRTLTLSRGQDSPFGTLGQCYITPLGCSITPGLYNTLEELYISVI